MSIEVNGVEYEAGKCSICLLDDNKSTDIEMTFYEEIPKPGYIKKKTIFKIIRENEAYEFYGKMVLYDLFEGKIVIRTKNLSWSKS